MNNLYLFLYLAGYFIFLVFCYIFILKRLKYLTEKHIEYTKVEPIVDSYIFLKRLIFVLLILLYVFNVFIILTFL